jgi:hypothetical protein
MEGTNMVETSEKGKEFRKQSVRRECNKKQGRNKHRK